MFDSRVLDIIVIIPYEKLSHQGQRDEPLCSFAWRETVVKLRFVDTAITGSRQDGLEKLLPHVKGASRTFQARLTKKVLMRNSIQVNVRFSCIGRGAYAHIQLGETIRRLIHSRAERKATGCTDRWQEVVQ